MSKSNKNGDYLINQIMMFSKFFENFKEKNDTNNMFVVLYEIRVLHGLMLLKLNKIIKKLSSVDKPGNRDLYDLSIFQNMVESTNDLIHDYENTLHKNIDKDTKTISSTEKNSEPVNIGSKDIQKDIDSAYNEEIGELKFKNKYNIENPTLINFYATWCEHSKNFMPLWKKIKTELKQKEINLIEVNCDKKKEKCKKFNIHEFPTIKMFFNEKMYSFDDSRSYDNIMKFVTNTIN